jgi:hypothetical protein
MELTDHPDHVIRHERLGCRNCGTGLAGDPALAGYLPGSGTGSRDAPISWVRRITRTVRCRLTNLGVMLEA